jgi:hypothetical protein
MSVLHPVPRCRRMNSLEKFYIQLFQQYNTSINEQSEGEKIPPFDHNYDIQLKHACAWPTFILSRLNVDFRTVRPADTTSPYLVQYLTYWQRFSHARYNIQFHLSIYLQLPTHVFLHFRMALRCTQHRNTQCTRN